MLSLRSSQHPPGHLHDATLVGKWRHDTSAEHHLDPPKPVTGVPPAFGARGGTCLILRDPAEGCPARLRRSRTTEPPSRRGTWLRPKVTRPSAAAGSARSAA